MKLYVYCLDAYYALFPVVIRNLGIAKTQQNVNIPVEHCTPLTL